MGGGGGHGDGCRDLCRSGEISSLDRPHGIVKPGDLIVTRRDGIRGDAACSSAVRDVFGFMESVVSSGRPHQPVIADIAQRMQTLRERHRQGHPGAKVLCAEGRRSSMPEADA